MGSFIWVAGLGVFSISATLVSLRSIGSNLDPAEEAYRTRADDTGLRVARAREVGVARVKVVNWALNAPPDRDERATEALEWETALRAERAAVALKNMVVVMVMFFFGSCVVGSSADVPTFPVFSFFGLLRGQSQLPIGMELDT